MPKRLEANKRVLTDGVKEGVIMIRNRNKE